MYFKRLCMLSVIVMGTCYCLISCSSKSLSDQRAQKEIEYTLEPGAQVTVKEGVATLTGTFPNQTKMKEAEGTARSTQGIKSIINNATIASSIHNAADSTAVAP